MIIFEQIFQMKKSLFFIVFMVAAMIVKANGDEIKPFTVVIDRGHDVIEKGVQVGEDSEYEILSTLVAQITGEVKDSIHVIYYNQSGEQLSIEERSKRINDLHPDLVISIHMGNSKNGARQAALILNDKNLYFEKSKELGIQLVSQMASDSYFSTIRSEVENRKLLELVSAPAFMIEIGNMNSPRDREYLKTNGAARLSKYFTAFLNELN